MKEQIGTLTKIEGIIGEVAFEAGGTGKICVADWEAHRGPLNIGDKLKLVSPVKHENGMSYAEWQPA